MQNISQLLSHHHKSHNCGNNESSLLWPLASSTRMETVEEMRIQESLTAFFIFLVGQFPWVCATTTLVLWVSVSLIFVLDNWGHVLGHRGDRGSTLVRAGAHRGLSMVRYGKNSVGEYNISCPVLCPCALDVLTFFLHSNKQKVSEQIKIDM